MKEEKFNEYLDSITDEAFELLMDDIKTKCISKSISDLMDNRTALLGLQKTPNLEQ